MKHDIIDIEATQERLKEIFLDDGAVYVAKEYGRDQTALDEAFNNWTDSLREDGELSEYAYDNITFEDLTDSEWVKLLELVIERGI